MATFSYQAAKSWSPDHIRDVLEDIERDLEQTKIDLQRETHWYGQKVTREKIEELEADVDFLRELLRGK